MKFFLNRPDDYFGKNFIKLIQDGDHTYTSDLVEPEGVKDPTVYVFDLDDQNSWEETSTTITALKEKEHEEPWTIICVSNVMSWFKTAKNEEPAENPLTEEDYKKRKPHPLYRDQVSVERLCCKSKKEDVLNTFVVCGGLCYGAGEHTFHRLFKDAWEGAGPLKCFGKGGNVVPTIHIRNLCDVVLKTASILPETQYILAVNEKNNTMMEITKSINKSLFREGKVTKVTEEELLLTPGVERFQIHQYLAPTVILEEDWEIEWVREVPDEDDEEGEENDPGFVNNMALVVKEYLTTRNITPIRILLNGPPGAGKSSVAKALTKNYRIPLVKVKDAIDEVLQKKTELSETIQKIFDDPKASDVLPDDLLIQVVREKLKSRNCLNQGYVLDGFPKTFAQADALFRQVRPPKPEGEEADDDDPDPENIEPMPFDETIYPDLWVQLEVDDEIAQARCAELDEETIKRKYGSAEGFAQKFSAWKENEENADSVVDVEERRDRDVTRLTNNGSLEEVVNSLLEKVGPPHNYGPTEEEIEAKRQAKLQAEEAEKQRLEAEKHEAEQSAMSALAAQRDREAARLADLQKEERMVLEVRSKPLRQYLMDHVIPYLTSTLIDIAKIRPDDPIDYLAEHLFQISAELDMDLEKRQMMAADADEEDI
eukprot:Rmarinus@m.7421